MDSSFLFDEAIELYRQYSSVHRRAISLDKFLQLQKQGEEVDYDSLAIRETLLEHVGILPVMAVFLYPHLEHKDHINLSRTLCMLAIHDLGEIVVGDMHPYKKTSEFQERELKVTLGMLPENLHELYHEYETRETYDAKFAKAVDVFAAFLSDQLLPPSVAANRFRHFGFSWQQIEEKRYEIFAWDATFRSLFYEIVARYQKIDMTK